jgi:hypothetical protein
MGTNAMSGAFSGVGRRTDVLCISFYVRYRYSSPTIIASRVSGDGRRPDLRLLGSKSVVATSLRFSTNEIAVPVQIQYRHTIVIYELCQFFFSLRYRTRYDVQVL